MHLGELNIKGIILNQNDKFLSANKFGQSDKHVIVSIETVWIPLSSKDNSQGALGMLVTLKKTRVWNKYESETFQYEKKTPEQVAQLINKGEWVRCI